MVDEWSERQTDSIGRRKEEREEEGGRGGREEERGEGGKVSVGGRGGSTGDGGRKRGKVRVGGR